MRIPIVETFFLLLFNSMIAGAPVRLVPRPQAVNSARFGLFSVFEPGAGEFIGLSLTNTSVEINDVALTWTDSNGTSFRTEHLSLPPGSQRVALVRELLGTPVDPAEGWLRIDSSAPGLLSYMTAGLEGILDAAAPVSMTSGVIILPHVAVDTGFLELGHTDTRISLVNPGSEPASAQAELIGLDGLVAGNLAIVMPARGSRTLRLSESFRDVLPPNHAGGRTFRGYMRVTSESSLAAWLQIETPLSRKSLRGFGTEEIAPEREVFASHFVFGGPALYHSELNLINAGNASVTLDMVAQDDRGMSVGQQARRTLAPGQAIREDVLSLFKVVIAQVYPPPLLSGYIRIRSADGGTMRVIGDMNITSGADNAALLYPVRAAASSSAILPFVISDSDYFTGYAIANPNELLTVQNDLTIELFDRDGRSVGTPRKVSLSPAARFAGLIEEKAQGGYVKIRANGPFAVLGSIGAWSGSMMAPLPGLQ